MHGTSRFRGGSSSEMIGNVSVAEFAMHAYATRCRIIMVFSCKIIIITCIALYRHEHKNRPPILCHARQMDMSDDTMARGTRAVCDVWKDMYGAYVGGPEIIDARDSYDATWQRSM